MKLPKTSWENGAFQLEIVKAFEHNFKMGKPQNESLAAI